MNNQESMPVIAIAQEPDVAVLEKNLLDEKISEILGQSAIDFLEKTLAEHLGESYKSSDLDVLEKINLILILASQKKTVIPPKLQQAVKKIHAILPNGQLDISYLKHLDGQKRKHFLQVLSSLVLLLGVSLGLGKSLISKAQNAENQTRVETSAVAADDNEVEKAIAKSEFELLFSEDLQTVVREMGWEDFLSEYTSVNNEALWSPEEVFKLLRTQEPRYWGHYIVRYPKTFLKVVADSKVTSQEFMSSCGAINFFDILDNQTNDEINWLDLWSMEELSETLKTTNPDWGKTVVNNQALFIDVLDKDELTILVQMLTVSSYRSNDIDYFLDNYNEDWDTVWSRRELLEAMKTGGFSWETLVRHHFELFEKDLTAEELSAVVTTLASVNSGQFPGMADSDVFSDYYNLNLYKIIDPAEFKQIIEKNFNAEAVQQIFDEFPELDQGKLEKAGLDKLFETKAINYVLDNYDEWKTTYPITDIMVYLRANNNKNNYTFIINHPELFKDEVFTDEEVLALAYGGDARIALSKGNQFFQHFTGDSGWQNQIPMERLLLLGRDGSNIRMYSIAFYFPEIFLPHFTDQDEYYLFVYNSREIEEADLLHTSDPLWQSYITPEYRRNLLELAKKDSEFDWKKSVGSGYYFFEDILTLNEVKEILSDSPYESIRTSALWENNVTPEFEYNFFKNIDTDAFVDLVTANPTRYKDLLTEEDRLILLKNNPREILRNYHFWERSFTPKFILDYFYSGQSEVEYGSLVLENKQIFGHLFYDTNYSFKDLITHEGDYTLFNVDSKTGQYYYEEWSEFVSLEEIFYLLKTFDRGKYRILENADLFFEYVEVSDLDQFLQTEYGILPLLSYLDDWQELWSPSDIYKSAKNNRAGRSAEAFFNNDKNPTVFIDLMQPEDLNFLIDSYPDDYSYGFGNDLDNLSQKWTASEIFAALQKEHPETWAMFVTEESNYFKEFILKDDLNALVEYGAQPTGLVDFGLWNNAEILDSYENHLPEKWGGIVLLNKDIFVDEVIKRNLSLNQLLEVSDLNGGDIDALHYWSSVWSEEEIDSAIEKLNKDLNLSQGG